MERNILVCMILVSVAVFACNPECLSLAGRREYLAIVGNSQASNSQMILRFDQYPIGTRIDIFLFAERCRSDRRFQPILARGGQLVVEDIVRRIESDNLTWNKVLLMSVLLSINEKCGCIGGDDRVIKRLEVVGSQFQQGQADAVYVRNYFEDLSILRNQTNAGPNRER